MKKILIFIFSIITLNVFAQDTKLDYSAAQMDSILNGTKKVDIPTHFNSNGDRQILDFDTKLLVDRIKSGFSNTDTRASNLRYVTDSLAIDSIDAKTGVVLGTMYLDNAKFSPALETGCTSYDEKIVIQKTDGTFILRNSNSINGKQIYPIGNYNVLTDDEVIYAQGGSIITLPSCLGNCTEKTIYRDACSDGLITVNVAGGGKIDGVHTNRILQVGRGAFTYECVNGEWRIKSEFFEPDQSCCSFSVLNSTTASVTVYTTDGLPYSVDWGNGQNSGPIASGVATSIGYGAAFTGSVKICKTCGVAPIYRVNFNSGEWNFDINDLNCLSGLRDVLIDSGTTTGDIANLPSGLTHYTNYGQNTTTGDIANLPSGLTHYANYGQNTTTGDIANLPSGLTIYGNGGQNTTTGDIANLPSGLTHYANYGQNTTTGDIANLPSGLTIYGNGGQNTTTGDIANLPNVLISYYNGGQNTVSDYSGGNLNSGITLFYSVPVSGGLNATEVDNLFIELETTLPGIGYINLTGANAAPTAASLTARNNLIAAGTTVIHN